MLVSIFGDSPLVGAAFIIVGAVLTFLGIRRGKAE
jgi:hypothetical protein